MIETSPQADPSPHAEPSAEATPLRAEDEAGALGARLLPAEHSTSARTQTSPPNGLHTKAGEAQGKAGGVSNATASRRNRRRDWSERIGRWPRAVQGVFWGLACALAVAVLGDLGRTHGFEGAALDFLFQTRNWRGARYPSPDVAIVVVDEGTVARYGFPIPRKYFADLVDYLKKEGARTIAFDIAFATPANDGDDDKRLAAACARAGNVVHAAAFGVRESQVPGATWSNQFNTKQPEDRFGWPDLDYSGSLGIMEAPGAFSARPELQAKAVALGHVNVFPELDYGTLRRIPHLIRFKGRLFPSLALAAALHALHLTPRAVSLQGNELVLGSGPDAPRVPLQAKAEALVNWIGGYDSFNFYPLENVLEHKTGDRGGLDPGSFKDKVVFVGAVNAGAFEGHPTPFAPSQPAVEMQANALDDILSRRLLREISPWPQFALLWGLPILLGILIAGRNARAALWTTLAAMLGCSGAALAMFHANLYWPFASPLLGLGATALCCVAFRQARDASQLKTAEERYELAVKGANDGIWDWDLASGEVYYAPRWKSLLGCQAGEVKPEVSAWLERVHPEDREIVEITLLEHREGRSPQLGVEFRMLHRDGSWRWVLARGLMIRGGDGAPARMAGSLSDITDRKGAEEKLLRQALSDELTGLPNRTLFLSRLQRAIARARQRQDAAFAVLFLDLDRFKIVNDSLGHLVGDEMLQAVARRLESCLRPGDTVARMGGDEFTLLIENIEGVHEALGLAERLHTALGAPLQIGGHDFATSASIGIAIATSASILPPALPQVLAPEPSAEPRVVEPVALLSSNGEIKVDQPPQVLESQAEDLSLDAVVRPVISGLRYAHAEELLRDADTAMYRAKSGGRARHVVFDEEMHALALSQLRLETALRRAIEKEHLQVFFQPIVSLDRDWSAAEGSSGGARGARVSGFEALVRWCDPGRGLIAPGEFIPFAEETGLIVALDQWVLRAACAQTHQWIDRYGRDDLWISVNLSGKRFEQANLVTSIQSTLESSGLPARNLRLEITESVVMGNAQSSAQTLEQLKALGLSLAVDDFGTGYSSLAYLHQFPLDVLKIDRSFVSRIAPGGANGEIVQAVVQLARSLSLSVVAEGVEEDYQAALLRALGCDYGQGYFFSRPVDAHAAEQMLR